MFKYFRTPSVCRRFQQRGRNQGGLIKHFYSLFSSKGRPLGVDCIPRCSLLFSVVLPPPVVVSCLPVLPHSADLLVGPTCANYDAIFPGNVFPLRKCRGTLCVCVEAALLSTLATCFDYCCSVPRVDVGPDLFQATVTPGLCIPF